MLLIFSHNNGVFSAWAKNYIYLRFASDNNLLISPTHMHDTMGYMYKFQVPQIVYHNTMSNFYNTWSPYLEKARFP